MERTLDVNNTATVDVRCESTAAPVEVPVSLAESDWWIFEVKQSNSV